MSISCVPAVIGVGSVVGIKSQQETSFKDSIENSNLWLAIMVKLSKHKLSKLWKKVNIEVLDGRVLVTGYVKQKDIIADLLKTIWQTKGVKDVINEIRVKKEINKDNAIKDGWITAKIKSKMLLDKKIKSFNYSVETIDLVVYIFGISRSQNEIDLVNKLASSIDGVSEVVSHVKLIK